MLSGKCGIGTLFDFKKERNPVTCNMNKPRRHYAK